jgi:hypothetical protein
VNYLREATRSTRAPNGRWWRELRGPGARVALLIRGESLAGHARAIETIAITARGVRSPAAQRAKDVRHARADRARAAALIAQRRRLDPGVRERLPLRGGKVVEPARDDALRVEAAARLEVGDRLPAAEGSAVRSRIAWNRRVRYSPSTPAGAHVLADQRPDLGVLEVRDRRRREDRAAAMSCRWRTISCSSRRRVLAAFVKSSSGTRRPRAYGRQFESAASRPARSEVAWMIISEIFSRMCGLAREAVGLGDQLREATS